MRIKINSLFVTGDDLKFIGDMEVLLAADWKFSSADMQNALQIIEQLSLVASHKSQNLSMAIDMMNDNQLDEYLTREV